MASIDAAEALRWVKGGCQHDCPDTCAWQVGVRDGRAVALRADRDHPITRGALCVKTHDYLAQRVYHPGRVLTPLRRRGARGDFEPVGWDRALAEIGERLAEIVAADGPEAVMPFSHQGSMGIVQERSIDRRFFARLGATRLLRDACGPVAAAGIADVIGPGVPMLPEQIVHSRFIVLWGTNTLVTNLHLWPLIEEARAAGATVVAIDPLATETARRADWHVRPLPGSDAALAFGLMHVIVRDGLVDEDYVARHAQGYAELAEHVRAYPPDVAARVTGVPAEQIERLARAYATAQPSVIRLMLGLEKHANGGAIARALACLPTLVGAWRHEGGGILHLTARLHLESLDMDAVSLPQLEDPAIRGVHWIQLGAALTELSDPPIRALVVYNSNPAVTVPDHRKVIEGLTREDLFLVVHEQQMTDTARLADYVLPATTMVEHWDLLRSWGTTYLALNQPAIEPCGEAVSISELFRRLARTMGFDEPYLQEPDLDVIQRALASDHPFLEGISFEALREHGWTRLRLPDPWLPHAEGDFATAAGRCRLDAAVPDEPPRVPAPDPAHPLALIATKSNPRLFNSTYGERLPRGRPSLDLNPVDAAARGVVDGGTVRVFNAQGAIHALARVGDRVPAGVVSLPHGWSLGASVDGERVNVLTRAGLSDIAGGADFYDTRVEVEAAPAVEAPPAAPAAQGAPARR
jgi:anaerobic selenocysteine-containing dehydrogenase